MADFEDYTVKELLDAAINRMRPQTNSCNQGSNRCVALALTKIEEAQMWFTRGVAIRTGKFNPADLEKANG